MMVNENLNEFLDDQRKIKYKYLGGARDNRTEATADPNYNNRNNTDMSPGATGRKISE